jgi:HTH-type transcriptional regulator/antitoxin HigA
MEQAEQTKSPGEMVREAMEAKGWNQTDLAYALGATTASVNQILSDKRGISANMARALGAALGLPAKAFARVQAEWDVLHNADDPDPTIAARARILSRYPLREMVRRGWVDPEHGNGSLEEQVCRFFGVRTIDEIPHLAHSARKTSYEEVSPLQLAWLFRVRQIAKEMAVEPYSKTKLEQQIENFKSLREDADGVRFVPRFLAAAGVRYVVVEGLPNSKIDGVCFWLDSHSPVIGMSIRADRIDNFWFVLRHECAHVLHGHGRYSAILDSDMDQGQASSEEEVIADREAADFCVPEDKMKSFFLRKKPFFAEREVMAFAKRMQVHPGLVVGQLHRLSGRYDLLRGHLVKVRRVLAGSMMMDGWGDTVPVER